MDRNGLISWTADLAKIAVNTANSGDLTPEEKENLLQMADQLTRSVELLANLIDTHESLIVDIVRQDFQFPSLSHARVTGPGHTNLSWALSAAYWIGSRGVDNPIIGRLDKLALDTSAAHARKSIRPADALDDKILEVARPKWLEQSKHRNANAMATLIGK
jgi:hypothetical protein